MDQQNIDPDILWTYKDLARFLRVSEAKVRHDVMDRKIPFIKIGRSVRFHKNQIAEFLKIKLDEPKVPVEKIVTKPMGNTFTGKYNKDSINDIAQWLAEKSAMYQFAEIGVKFILHEGKIRRIEKTVVEKIQKK